MITFRSDEQGQERQREDHGRERLQGVQHDDEDRVEEAAPPRGRDADQDAYQKRGEDGWQGDGEGDPDAVDQSRQDIPAQLVRAEKMFGARTLEPVDERLLVGRVRGDEAGGDGEDDQEAHDQEADHARRPAQQLAERGAEATQGAASGGPARGDRDVLDGTHQPPRPGWTRMRGSAIWYAMSAARFASTNSTAITSTPPRTTG